MIKGTRNGGFMRFPEGVPVPIGTPDWIRWNMRKQQMDEFGDGMGWGILGKLLSESPK